MKLFMTRMDWRTVPSRPEDLVLLPGAGEFTRRVRDAGYLAVLATNQPGVAKGRVTIEGLDRIHEHLLNQLARDGGGLDRVCYCPHHPSAETDFRLSSCKSATAENPARECCWGPQKNGHRPRAILDGGRQDARRQGGQGSRMQNHFANEISSIRRREIERRAAGLFGPQLGASARNHPAASW